LGEVTVVVPTRNRSSLLRQTLHSITAQQGVDTGIVVVDDASTDDTAEVVGRMPGVRLVRHDEPTEQRIARNHGAEVATTPWLAFCDDDDLWAPTKLRTQLAALRRTGADWCTSSALHVDEALAPIGGERLRRPRDIDRLIAGRNVVPGGGSGVVVRRSLFEAVGGFDDDARFAEDWDLWIRLSRAGTAVCVDELLVAYRRWAHTYSHQAFDDQYACYVAVADRAAAAVGSSPAGAPRRSSQYEARQRLGTEPRWSVARDLPRLVRQTPGDAIPILMMLGLPDSTLTSLRLRRLGRAEVARAERWLAPYRRGRDGVEATV
jgi:glycosyltransferase involved in cell wall biosynthesis